MSELRRLAKTCDFGAYLDTALWDQFVRGLWDVKCQRDLLCVTDLTAELALKKARAAEVVLKETEGMQAYKRELESYPVIQVKYAPQSSLLSMWATGARSYRLLISVC